MLTSNSIVVSPASSRNHTNSSQTQAAQAAVALIQTLYPDLLKIRLKKHCRGNKLYVLRVKTTNRTFTVSGFGVENTCKNFLNRFNSEQFFALN